MVRCTEGLSVRTEGKRRQNNKNRRGRIVLYITVYCLGYNYIRFLIITCCQTIDELFVENGGNINYDKLIKLYLQY